MKRITKREAVKRFNSGQPVTLSPCKMYPGGPFSMGITVFGKDYDGWEKMYNNWSFYNANYECGYYAHYYKG